LADFFDSIDPIQTSGIADRHWPLCMDSENSTAAGTDIIIKNMAPLCQLQLSR
jgi:hypothetical protein